MNDRFLIICGRSIKYLVKSLSHYDSDACSLVKLTELIEIKIVSYFTVYSLLDHAMR